MSIATCITALQTVVGDALGAAVVYTAMPEEAPARFPAVVTRWTSTLPTGHAYSSAAPYGTLARNGRRHVHNVTLYIVISQRRNLKDEDIASQQMAQRLVEALDSNVTLDGACAEAAFNSVRPDVIVWGDSAFYMLVAETQIVELT